MPTSGVGWLAELEAQPVRAGAVLRARTRANLDPSRFRVSLTLCSDQYDPSEVVATDDFAKAADAGWPFEGDFADVRCCSSRRPYLGASRLHVRRDCPATLPGSLPFGVAMAAPRSPRWPMMMGVVPAATCGLGQASQIGPARRGLGLKRPERFNIGRRLDPDATAVAERIRKQPWIRTRPRD